MITRQQIRAVLHHGGQVIDPAGHPVGRIVDVVLGAQTSQPTWAIVDCHLCGGIEVAVPLARAQLLGGCVQVPYTAADVCGAPRANGPAGHLHLQPGEELDRYYADLDDGAPVMPHHHADRGTAAAPVHTTAGPGAPVVATDGHRRADGASPGSLLVDSGADALPVLPGLDVRTGNDGPAAYPATSSGPWPPVWISSPGPPWWHRRHWRWLAVPASIRAMRLELHPFLDMTGLPETELDDLVLAASEAAANAVEHAQFSTLPFFDVLTEVGENSVRIVIQDHGRWRTPTAAGHRGRGLQMMGALADATLTVGSRGTTAVLRNRTRSPG
ncbi:Anti-sigma regulatory factor (Ser/Thr protein kinase) [Geodermatophilus africanus]|uniref:Anti-sigma regulatory factor (Ser/Thr protein kinase) n=1 Tax=Geodermatophilus africanus TaxID=1137993 RepID=A0A1H3MZ30_9ACTN|nr:ATP-binding protein [Geodermatophilus africanus]SDY81937.1 Anti-sigma regulatory factor (Ser/Thr protein kinase) [Geodermatophilus africanus]